MPHCEHSAGCCSLGKSAKPVALYHFSAVSLIQWRKRHCNVEFPGLASFNCRWGPNRVCLMHLERVYCQEANGSGNSRRLGRFKIDLYAVLDRSCSQLTSVVPGRVDRIASTNAS